MSVIFDEKIKKNLISAFSEDYFAAIENFYGDFSNILYVNLKRDQIKLVCYSDEFAPELVSMAKTSYSGYRDFFIKNFVFDSDREWFNEVTSPEYIKEQLSKKPYLHVTFSQVYKGRVYKEYIKFACVGNDTNRILISGHSVNRTVYYDSEYARNSTERRHDSIIAALANDFDMVYYLDDADQKTMTFHTSDRFAELLSQYGDVTDCVNMVGFIDSIICPEDLAKFKRKSNRKVVRDKLKKKDAYDVFVRLSLEYESEPSNYLFRFVQDSVRPEGVIIGIKPFSEDLFNQVSREELEQTIRMMEKQLEITLKERTSEIVEKTKTLNRVNEDIIELLGDITEARDVESGEHIRRVKGFTHILAEQVMVDWPEYGLTGETVELMTSASALHDIGKIMIPDAILLKPGRLTKEEFEIMKTHSVNGCEILKKAPRDWSEEYLRISMDICRYHHEKWDGNGYPDGLKGDQIPISAQIVSVADCFDALTTKRVYKDAVDPDVAFNMILNGECGQFSDKLMSSFRECKRAFISHVTNPDRTYVEGFRGRTTVGCMSGLKILFVECDEISREVGRNILEGEGVSITEVKDGGMAYEMIKTMPPDSFDAILMNVLMPEMSGPETTRAIRALDRIDAKTIPIIAITSSTSEVDIKECLDAGMDAYVNKPISIKILTRTLLDCMRSRSEKYRIRLNEAEKYIGIDHMTGVKNITSYTSTVEELAKRIEADKDIQFALLKCDINDLAYVNENGGHNAGNSYIMNCCDIIRNVFSNSDIYRIGSDEFLVVIMDEDYANKDKLFAKLKAFEAEAEEMITIGEGKTSFAYGLVSFDPNEDHSVGDVIKKVSRVMEENKELMKFRRKSSV